MTDNSNVAENTNSAVVLDIEIDSSVSLFGAALAAVLGDLRNPTSTYTFEELNAMEGRIVRFTNVGRNIKVELLPVEE